MVFGDVEYRGCVCGKRGGRLELEARDLQHPQARGASCILAAHECVQHGRPDVSGDLAVDPRGSRHRAGEGGYGALAVGARHRDDPRATLRERLREQFDVTHDLHAASSVRRTAGSASGTPGLTATRSMPANISSRSGPQSAGTDGSERLSSASRGGAARVSATRTDAPRRASHFAIDKPVSPKPSTSTFLPAKFTAASK